MLTKEEIFQNGIKFDKMHALGNDFVIIDMRESHIKITKEFVINIGNRKTGIGFDQLILIYDSSVADLKMEIYNQDGSIAEACGNGTRCVAWLYKTKSIEAKSGILSTEIISQDEIKVSMGKPTIYQAKSEDLLGDNLIKAMYLSIGNPHLIFILQDLAIVDFIGIGTKANQDSYYENGVNVSFLKVVDRNHIELIVFERGVGLTSACGTAACASVVACHISEMVDSNVLVSQKGGNLTIEYNGHFSEIYMIGGATPVFEGVLSSDNVC